MGDLTYIDRDLEVKIVGQDATGNTVNYVSADANGNLFVKDYSDGPVTPGTAAGTSSLAGGQFNTVLPTLTNTQQSAIQLDSSGRLIVSPTTQGILAEDHNYGTVGANTLRTASQIGNATGSADFNAGATGAQTLRVSANQGSPGTAANAWFEKITDGTNVAAVKAASTAAVATDPALVVAISPNNTVAVTQSTSPWITKDQSDGPVTPGAVASFSQLIGGQFNTALPTLTNTQQSAIQLDSSGRIIIAPTTQGILAEDHNYGTVGANTLRTASEIGNATGSADFNYGTVGAQTLRVASQIGNATGAANFGSGATGAQTLRVEANQGAVGAAAWLTTDAADGPVAAGTAALKSILIGGQFNTTLPTLTTGQQAALQTDSSGRLLVSGISQDVAPATINITTRDIASTTAVGANGQNFITGAPTANSTASFAFTSECTVVVQVTGVWTGTLQIETSMDSGTTWSPYSVNQDGTSYILNAFTANFTGRSNVSAYTNFRVRAIAAVTGTATVKIVESVNPATVFIANAIKLTDNSGDSANITANNDLEVSDTIDTAGQYRAQSVTTTAAEALGAATILTTRKMLSITPTNGTVYWGFSNAVTTTTGTPIFKNQNMVFAIGQGLHVYLICAAGTVDCRIAEGS